MVNRPSQGQMFPEATPVGIVAVNERCLMRTLDGHRTVSVAGMPIAHFAVGDRMSEAHAMVSLVEQGWADQNDVARAFACSARTVRRCQRRFETGGLASLTRQAGYPRGRSRLRPSRLSLVRKLKADGASNREIATRIGVSEMAVRKLLRRLGFRQSKPTQRVMDFTPAGAPCANPNLSALSPSDIEELDVSVDTNPLDRAGDRFLAYLGLLNDATPLFASGKRLACAGALLAMPALVRSGVVDCAREVYGCIGPAFFGLRTTVVALVLMALLRIRCPENLKERPPVDLGRVLGLDRAPEVKTLRRKLRRLASAGRATDFGRALAQRRVAAHDDALGFLYVDGHVRVYHGKHDVSKTHVARIRIAMPAVTDYWVNDARRDPLFVVTGAANTGLCKALPAILDEVRALVGGRPTTVVFDRGGWSPTLFKRLIDGGFVTARRDLTAIEVAFRMFERWRQENFFKYMREEFALDALADYGIEKDDPTREVPNPRWAALDAELKAARAELQRVTARYGLAAVTNDERLRRTMRGFKIANATAGQAVSSALKRCVDIENRRAKVPRRVPVQQAHPGEAIKLTAETKHLTSVLKMMAYQVEGELMLTPHYKRAEDEGRTLIQNALASTADIEVTDTELRVRLTPLSCAHRTRALAALCEQFDATNTVFPGTRLRLRYAVDAAN